MNKAYDKPRKDARSVREDLRPEYDFSKGIRGRHARKTNQGILITVFSPNERTVKKYLREQKTLVTLEPDVAKVFKDARDVNTALRRIMRAKQKPRRKLGS
ncbi:MAG: hypothetical protein HW412_1412 [Bacteroidetes bacterium]|nr:hypothetical protein [Bacteroidota bacterium]